MATVTLYVKRPRYASTKAWKLALDDGLRYLRSITPVLTGYMKDSWFLYSTDNHAAYVNTASYSSYINDGTIYMKRRNLTGKLMKVLTSFTMERARQFPLPRIR